MAEKKRNINDEKREKWHRLGFVRYPFSDRQAAYALSAKDFIEGFDKNDSLVGMLASGMKYKEIVKFAQENSKSASELKFHTIAKYLQLYRRYFLKPFESVEAATKQAIKDNAGARGHRGAMVLLRNLDELTDKREEIDELWALVTKQKARIERQLTLEQQMQLPISGLRMEIETAAHLLELLITTKKDLGLPGWVPMPKEVRLTAGFGVKVDTMTQEEKQQVVKVGKEILNIIEMSRTQNGSYEAEPKTDKPEGESA